MIYLVTGYMRSGTSMMMSCLEAGGLPVLKSAERDQFNAAFSDALYQPNPNGLYEPSLSDLNDPTFPRRYDGHAVKVVAPFIGRLAVAEYSVLFMRRDFEEIRQSFEAAFRRRLDVKRIEAVVAEALANLKNRRDVVSIATLDYRSVLERPLGMLRGIGWPFDAAKASSVVRREAIRFKREELVAGL